jgi:hypothetical protein
MTLPFMKTLQMSNFKMRIKTNKNRRVPACLGNTGQEIDRVGRQPGKQ